LRRTVAVLALLLVLVFASVVLAACSGGSGSADDLAAQYPNASEYQLELLADGVTWAEYEKATVDLVACMEDQGSRRRDRPVPVMRCRSMSRFPGVRLMRRSNGKTRFPMGAWRSTSWLSWPHMQRVWCRRRTRGRRLGGSGGWEGDRGLV